MRSLCCVLLLFHLALPLFTQVDFDVLNFQETFREGVIRFHRGSYNEAILSFQRSLGFIFDDYLAREWLGRAYYFSGYEAAALSEWRQIESLAPPFLQNFIDAVEARQSLAVELREDYDFFVVKELKADEYARSLINPGGIGVDGSGQFFINSFGNNVISSFDQSAKRTLNLTGGRVSLLGPFDLQSYDGRLYVSNFLGDHISVLNMSGNTMLTFGSAGIGEGEFLGPQYLSISDEPALYVSDHGNQRVSKFSLNGDFLFHFGEPEIFQKTLMDFEGFSGIAGLVSGNGGVYVANNLSDYSEILFFDNNANLIERFILNDVSQIEDLSITETGDLVVTSRRSVYSFDPLHLSVKTLHQANDNEKVQFISAIFDDNENLLISDFLNNRLLVLSRLSGIYSGYHVEIQRIDQSLFPEIFIEVSVHDILGNSVLGLNERNFIFTEEGIPFDDWSLEYSGSLDRLSTVAFIMEASDNRRDINFRNKQEEALLQALSFLPNESTVRLFSAGVSSVLEFDKDSNPLQIPELISTIGADPQWKFDQALRLAGNRLILDQKKREIVFLGNGTLPDWAFDSITLSQTLAYLKNNHIRFSMITVLGYNVDPALIYLIEQTSGVLYTTYEEITELKDEFLARRTGLYIFNTKSTLNSEFGRKYLPVEAEVIHFTKTGRDESGYFAPLEF